MRHFIIIAILFISESAYTQSKLNIYLDNCKTDKVDTTYSLSLYKDNNFLKTLHWNDTVLNDLDKGFYTINYKSFFGESFVDTINITKDTSYWTFICVDDIKDYTKAYKKIKDSLIVNKGVVITFVSYGCFHWESQKLKVFKKEESYFATLYPIMKVREHKKAKDAPKTKKLSEKQLNALLMFQLQSYMYAETASGGTENTWCTYKYKNSSLKIIDNADTESMKKLFNNLLKIIYGI